MISKYLDSLKKMIKVEKKYGLPNVYELGVESSSKNYR